ncbi:MAG: hypothetical protein WCO26_24415, partial [Deltaproteobacteria bacterium]
MDLVIFEDNKPFVLEALGNGEFDTMEAASEVFEADFFRFIKARVLLDELAVSCPTPRKKGDVPFWFLCSQQSFHAAPRRACLRCVSLVKKEAAAIGEFRSWSSCTVP